MGRGDELATGNGRLRSEHGEGKSRNGKHNDTHLRSVKHVPLSR